MVGEVSSIEVAEVMPSLSSIRDYILPVAAPVAGALINRRAAGSAVNNLRQGANTAMDTINTGATNAGRTLADVYAEQKGTLQPFIGSGAGALDTLAKGTEAGGEFNRPITMADFELYKDPGFQWRVEQGERAIKAGANAGGIRFSGATLKALSNYNQESASQEAAAAYGRYQGDLSGRFDRTSSVANRSFDAANQAVNAGGTYGANLANLQTGTARSLADLQTDLASAEAMGDTAKASALTNAINSILSGVENVGTAKTLASLIPKAAGTAGTAAALAGIATPTAAQIGGTVNAMSAAGIGFAPLAGGFGAAGPTGVGTTSIIGSTTGSTGLTGALGLGGGSGMFGLGAMTIPVLGAGIAAAAYFLPKLFGDKKAQAAADYLTRGGGVHDEIKNGINAIDAAQELNPQQKAEAKEALARKIENELVEFSKKDKHAYYKAKATLQDFARWGFGVRPLLG